MGDDKSLETESRLVVAQGWGTLGGLTTDGTDGVSVEETKML